MLHHASAPSVVCASTIVPVCFLEFLPGLCPRLDLFAFSSHSFYFGLWSLSVFWVSLLNKSLNCIHQFSHLHLGPFPCVPGYTVTFRLFSCTVNNKRNPKGFKRSHRMEIKVSCCKGTRINEDTIYMSLSEAYWTFVLDYEIKLLLLSFTRHALRSHFSPRKYSWDCSIKFCTELWQWWSSSQNKACPDVTMSFTQAPSHFSGHKRLCETSLQSLWHNDWIMALSELADGITCCGISS